MRSIASNTTAPTVRLVNRVLKEIKGLTESVDCRALLRREKTEAQEETRATRAPLEKKKNETSGPQGNFSDLECVANWVNRSEWFDIYREVHCDRRKFLQGFSL